MECLAVRAAVWMPMALTSALSLRGELGKYQSTSGISSAVGRQSYDRVIERSAQKVGRLAQACLRLLIAGVILGTALVYFSFGTLAPCDILRAAVKQRDDFAAALPDGVIDFALETHFGRMSANRCSLVLLNELNPLQSPTKQTELRQPPPDLRAAIRSVPTCGNGQCRH